MLNGHYTLAGCARTTLMAASLLALPTVSAAGEVVIITGEHESRGYEGRERTYDSATYALEVEPHFSFGAENVYGASGFGAGLRVSIPLIAGHLGRVPQNLALSFGGDILHYDNCYYGSYCGANYLLVPVAAQWNVFVLRRFSLFAEAGAFVYKGWFNDCGPSDGPNCSAPSNFGVLPTIAFGARLHVGDNVAFVARLGYPTTTLGISFL